MKRYAYHQWSVPDCEHHFRVKVKEGLSDKEADFRLEKFGPNSLQAKKIAGPFSVFIRQFKNIFSILLIVAAIISYFIDGIGQAAILIAIIILNVVVGFYQEYKAERTLAVLKSALSYKSRVLRHGEIAEINSDELVAGDIVILREGDRISADMRIFEEQGLRVDEATLTGESSPVSKHTEILPLETPLAERMNMAFSGTVVYAGIARGIVVKTGENTEFGKIADMVGEEEETTPLKKRIVYISKILFVVSLVLALIIFALGLWRGFETLKLLTFSIALFISAVPESLPTIITLALAVGVSNMAHRKAIVRRLSVIEALGSVNIIATDKTGTLTKNQLEVTKCAYYKKDEFIEINQFNSTEAQKLLLFAGICSSASGDKESGFIGDPLETAILKSLDQKNLDIRNRFKLKEELPFDSDKKYMMVQGSIGQEKWHVVKGAVEKVLPFCSLKKIEKIEIEDKLRKFSENGLKSIAVCRKKISSFNIGNLRAMEFVGILGFSDQPILNIKESIQSTIEAGIRPIIITGDNPQAAKYIAEKVGLDVSENEIISGLDIENLTDEGLKIKLKTIKIFARATPSDKIRVVDALEKMGFIVAVTGDGVNDAPALKAATVGISMGKRGSDVSREASDIILADDNYSTIISAIAYGRAIYDNIRNALVFLLASNFDELFLIGFAFVADLPIPLTVTQILWINLVTGSLPAISLALGKTHRGILKEKPRSSRTAEVRSAIIYSACLGSVSLLFGFIFYLWGLHDSVAKARTLVFLASIIVGLVFAFSIRMKTRFWKNPGEVFRNNYLNVSVIISLIMTVAVLLPVAQPFFGTTNLNLTEIFAIIGAGLLSFIAAEIIRAILDRKKSR